MVTNIPIDSVEQPDAEEARLMKEAAMYEAGYQAVVNNRDRSPYAKNLAYQNMIDAQKKLDAYRNIAKANANVAKRSSGEGIYKAIRKRSKKSFGLALTRDADSLGDGPAITA